MDLLKTLLLCLMILYGYVRKSESKDFYNVKHKKPLTSADKIKSKALITSECYCFPKNPQGKRISEYISQNGEQQGRLVVYLFKNKNKITMYVPNKEKQRFLPDLTFDVNDKLTPVNTENVFDLYNIYSDVTTSNSNVNEMAWQKIPRGSSSSDIYFSPQSLDQETLKALIAKINKYYSFNVNNAPKQDEVLHTKPDQKLYIQLQSQDKFPSINDLLLPGGLTVFPSPSKTNDSTETSGKYPNIKDLILPGDLTVLPIPLEIIETLNTSKTIQDTHKITPPTKPYAPEYVKIQHQLPSKVNDVPEGTVIQNKPTQIHLHADKVTENVNPALHPSHFIVGNETKNIYNVPSNLQYLYRPSVPNHQIVQDNKYMFVIDDINGKHIPYSQNSHIALDPHVIEEVWSSVSKPSSSPSLELTLTMPQLEEQLDHKVISGPKKNSGQKIFFILPENELSNQLTFDRWFQKRVESIARRTHFLSRKINQSQLAPLILEALRNKGINLSSSGYLIDSDGNTLDMSKLQLLLTWMGYTSDYNQMLAGKKIIDPFSLKVILVNVAKPPSILGIIPLGETLKEKPISTKPICNLDNNKKKPTCKGSCQNVVVLEKDKLTTVGKPVVNINKDNIGSLKKLKSKKKGKLLGKFISSRLADDDSEEEYADENDIIIEDKQASMDIDVPEEEGIEGIEEDNGSLGLRIIGGQPATSSGTPVKSKGRSGYPY